jgi:hypothetical protein
MTATLVDVNATEEVPDGPSPFERSPFLIPAHSRRRAMSGPLG